jgi:uncharacterized cysteine cluster protein YcgN (CxxCxxCC family)
MPNNQTPFWKTKTLQELTRQEWELLCDGCGLCCLQKLEDRKTGRIDYTNVSCYLLDIKHCRCRSYENRMFLVTLVSGDIETVHLTGISAKDRVISEEYVHPDDIEAFIVQQ